MFKKIFYFLMVLVVLSIPSTVLADVAVGDVIVTLGEDLTDTQKANMLEIFNPPENAQLITVSNEEEHTYLDGVISSTQIGTRAISSAMITFTEDGSGVTVSTSNINYISDQTYINALITAGVKNAEIQISSPIEVSGTAALTGIMKAYEMSTGVMIDEDVKRTANEEMVTTANLADEIGEDEATDLINEIKKQIAETNPKTIEDIQKIISDVMDKFDISLSQEQIDALVSLFNKMKDLDIDWDELKDQITNISSKASEYISSEEGQNFLSNLKTLFGGFIDWLKSLF